MSEQPKCELCGEPMPPGEEMFKYHGYSGPCPGANWDVPLTPKEQALIDKPWETYKAAALPPVQEPKRCQCGELEPCQVCTKPTKPMATPDWSGKNTADVRVDFSFPSQGVRLDDLKALADYALKRAEQKEFVGGRATFERHVAQVLSAALEGAATKGGQ